MMHYLQLYFGQMVVHGGLHLLRIVVFAVIWAAFCANEDKCSKQHCDKGQPVLMHDKCLCVESAK